MMSINVVLNRLYLFYAGAYSHYCDGAVNQAGRNLFSHIVIYPKAQEKLNSEDFWAFK